MKKSDKNSLFYNVIFTVNVKIKAVRSSETSVTAYNTTEYGNPEVHPQRGLSPP
jgi:hypothetical protein